MWVRKPLVEDVYALAQQRISDVFDTFERVSVSFSGGKDSTVLLHITMAEAKKRNRKVTVLFIDWEAQLDMTIQFIRSCYERYAEWIDPVWVCLPMRTTNACSQIEPEWTCWEPAKRALWVRDTPPEGITDEGYFPFYQHAMTFEEFVPAWGSWFASGGDACVLVGVRAAESLNRYRTLICDGKETWSGRRWTTVTPGTQVVNAYPLYDWKTEDIWTYFGHSSEPYNPFYDRMYQAGLSIHQMRICEPYGDEQRRGLWLYHVTEPQTWSKVCARVAGANGGALYAAERGNVMGNGKIELPAGHTWESFSCFLLDTMPDATAEHYRSKIAVYLKWYRDHNIAVPDQVDGDTGSKDVGSWRRICKVLLKQDYWCKGLSFSPTKTSAYSHYQELMKKRRKAWGIFTPEEEAG